MKTKLAILSTILILLLSYVVWIFYMSEPKYIDNPEGSFYPEKYDVVSFDWLEDNQVEVAMIIQINTTSMNNKYATSKSITKSWDEFYRLEVGTVTPKYHVIGHGTFYHRVNHFVGFNIMLITTICILIIAAVILVVCIGIVREMLGFY